MRFFDVPQANQLVPMLQQVFDSVRPQLEKAQNLARRLEMLEQIEPKGKDALALRQEMTSQLEGIREEIAKLEEIGIEIKALDGLVDFRAIMKGRQVYLCWRSGESRITHWHELETGYAGRQAIRDESEFERTYVS